MAQGEAQGLDTVQSANRIAMMQQSLDATAGLVGNTVRLLRDRPELAAGAPPLETWRAIVAEVARWDAPVQNTRRFAAADLTLAGQAIAQGQGVLLLLASANRDQALNRDPDVFDPARTAAQHDLWRRRPWLPGRSHRHRDRGRGPAGAALGAAAQ